MLRNYKVWRKFLINMWKFCLSRSIGLEGAMQRRSQNEAEEAMAPPKKNLLRFVAGVLYQSQLFKNKRKEQSDTCSVVFSY